MKCKYCHKPAGFFSTKHKECEQKHFATIEELRKIFSRRFFINESKSSFTNYNEAKEELANTISSGYISDDIFDGIVTDSLNDLLKKKAVMLDYIGFKTFMFSIPEHLKQKVLNTSHYNDFWANYFFLKFLTVQNDEEEKIKEYQALMKEVKINDSVSKSINESLLLVLSKKINEYLEDGIIDNNEEEQISKFLEYSSLSDTATLYKSSAYQRLIQSLILRDIQEGKDVEKRLIVGNLPILLGKKEQLLWVFKDVKGYEEKTGRKYVGGSSGVSMRVCKGVYYRVGASKGHSIEYQYQNDLGRGVFIITNKNLYFIGDKQVKMGISKVLSYKPYSDGIELVKDGANPKPYTFVGFDSWFVVNAMQLLVE